MKYRYRNIVATTYKKIPKSTWTLAFSSLWTVFAPILAINVVMGTNIRKAGIFTKPMLRGMSTFLYNPEKKKPIAPNNEIINPMAAALPIALLIEYPKYLKTGTLIIAPVIPIGAEIKPEINPNESRGSTLNEG